MPATLEIILIGPIGVGKSTIARLLAEQLNLPRYALDDLRWDYYAEIGFDKAHYQALGADLGLRAAYEYGKTFEIYAVEQVLQAHRNCVIDFGGGHSVYEDAVHLARAEAALAPFPNVVLLLPAPDPEESLALLRSGSWDGKGREIDFHALFVRHPSNRRLAKQIIYTKGKSPQETCTELLARLGLNEVNPL